MGLWTDIVGSVRGYIRLGLTGVRLKNSSGALAVRAAGDSADASVTCAGITLSDKVTFADGTLLNSSPTGQFKNKIIGGDFSLNPWQRGTSRTNPGSTNYVADRFVIYKNTAAAVDCFKTADAPTAAEAGVFTQHCMHFDVTTADTSIGTTDAFWIEQRIEGYNALSFGFGQSGTRYVTLSFWVKSTKTGTFCVAFVNSAENRSYVAEYTVSSSNTWEKKIVTFATDTSGTWLYDSGIGLRVYWTLAAGSTFHTTAGAWQAGVYTATSNQVNALDSTSNDFKLALIQLEAGSVATPFETRPVGAELALCHRYYYMITPAQNFSPIGSGQCSSTTTARIHVPYPVPMRVAPTALEQSGTASDYSVYSGGSVTCTSVPTVLNSTTTCGVMGMEVNFTTGATLTTNRVALGRAGTTAGYLGFSAEL